MKTKFLLLLAVAGLSSSPSWGASLVIYQNSSSVSRGVAARIASVQAVGSALWIRTEFGTWLEIPYYRPFDARLAEIQISRSGKSIDVSACLDKARILSRQGPKPLGHVETRTYELKVECTVFNPTPLYPREKAPEGWYEMRDVQRHPLIRMERVSYRGVLY